MTFAISLRRRRASLAPGAGREGCLHFAVDQSEGLREGGFYIQIRGIQQDGVLRLAQRRDGARAVALVAREQIRLDHLRYRAAVGLGCDRVAASVRASAAWPARGVLASMNSLAAASGQITVPISRPSITAPRASPGGCAAKSRWKLQHSGAHFGDCRHHRCGLAHCGGAQAGVIDARRDRSRVPHEWRPPPRNGYCRPLITPSATSRYSAPESRWANP